MTDRELSSYTYGFSNMANRMVTIILRLGLSGYCNTLLGRYYPF